jgi:Tol biopolymer transport system component
MNPNGTGVKQLTFNRVRDSEPGLSPDGQMIAYVGEGIQTSNPQGDAEVYVMNALNGSGKKILSNSGLGVDDYSSVFSPGSTRVSHESYGIQTSNPEGDWEVYRVNVPDGSGKRNLTNNGDRVFDDSPEWGVQAF